MKAALLVIDMQKAYFTLSPVAEQSLKEACDTINAGIALFRAHGLPVVCVHHVDAESSVVPGMPGFEVAESLALTPEDLRIHKTYGNAFNKTGLGEKLREWGVDTVILTGFCAEYCVLSTCRGAEDLDFTPILLRGALASVAPENIAFVERVNEVISPGALAKMLE